MANLFQPSLVRALDSNGNPVSGAKMYFYLTGTTTPATFYLDQEGATPGTSPHTADSTGKFAPAYVDPEIVYRIKLTTSDGAFTLYDIDPVRGYDEGSIQTAAESILGAEAEAQNSRDLARLYAVSSTDAAITGAVSSEDRGARYEATRAGVAAAQALVAQEAAEDAQGLAEVAAQQAIDGADLYVDSAAGIAGTANGDYFKVPSVDGTTLYKNVAGVATLVNVTPSQDALDEAFTNLEDRLIFNDDPDIALGVLDGAGFINPTFIGQDGDLHGPQVAGWDQGTALAAIVTTTEDDNPIIGPIDGDGFMPWAITNEEINHPHIAAIETDIANLQAGATTTVAVSTAAGLLHILTYGQSPSVGGQTVGLGSNGVYTTAELAYAYRFIGGNRSQDAGRTDATAPAGPIYTSLVPFKETVIYDSGSSGDFKGETINGAALVMIAQLLQDNDGIVAEDALRCFLASAPGEGSTTIAQLSDGTIYFDRLKDDITYGAALAESQLGMSYDLAVLNWLQGESDVATSYATYLAALREIRLDVQTHYQTLPGVTRGLPMLTYQVCTHPLLSDTTPYVACAQADASLDDLIAMASPTGHIPRAAAGNNLHFSPTVGMPWLGAYFGKAIYEWILRGVKPTALLPVEYVLDGLWIAMRFPVDSDKALEIDTAMATNGYDNFTLVDGDGNDVALTASGIIDRDWYAIKAASTPTLGWKVRAGWVGDSYAGFCRLRDNDPTIFQPAGLNKHLKKYVPIFERPIVA